MKIARVVAREKRRLTRLIKLGLVCAAVASAGCSDSEVAFTTYDVGGSSGSTTVRGVLASSAGGQVALLDAPLPAGFTALGGAAVRVVGRPGVVTSRPDGALEFSATEARPRLLVTPPGGPTSAIEVAGFAANAGPAVALQNFPPRLKLGEGETAAVRSVGVDALGRYLQLSNATQTVSDVSTNPPIPLTSTLAAGILQQSLQTDGSAGNKQIRSNFGGLSQATDASTYSQPCQASLTGLVTDANGDPVSGALVEVVGNDETAITDSNGRYTIEGLAPLPSEVRVYLDNQEIGLGLAPLTSQLTSELHLPARPTSYSAGSLLAGPTSNGVAVRPNGSVYVSSAGGLAEYDTNGQPVTLPPSTPAPQTPVAVAADFNGQPYVADAGAGQVVFLSGDNSAGVALSDPSAVAVDASANIFALQSSGSGFTFAANTGVNSWSEPAQLADGMFSNPSGIAARRDGWVFVADSGNNRIAVLELTQDGRVLHGDPSLDSSNNLDNLQANLIGHWTVQNPRGVAVGPSGEVYVATDQGVVVSDGTGHDPIQVSSRPALGGVGVTPAGEVWVVEAGGVQLYRPGSASVVLPQPPAPTGQSLIQNAALTSMETSLQNAMRNLELPGATVAVSVNGRLVLWRGYGYAEQTPNGFTPTQPDMLFRLASCSKSFTAAATLLQMQDYPSNLDPDLLPFSENGLLAGGVSGYDLTTRGLKDQRQSQIRIADLLRMTAGLDSPGPLYYPLAKTLGGDSPPATAIETLRYIYSHLRLSSSPNTTYVYSDVAYMSLGRVIEAVASQVGSPQTYAEYVQQRLLANIGITDMRLANTNLGGTAPGEVHYYPYSAQQCGPSVFAGVTEQVPATYGAVYDGVSHDSTGGWIASVTDLVRLANSLAPNGEIAGFPNPLDGTRQEIFKALPDYSGASYSSYFGCGWQMFAEADGSTVNSMYKDGGLPGTMTYVTYLKQGEDEVVWAYLINSQPGPSQKRKFQGRQQFQAPIAAFVQSQAGQWPTSGDLFPTEP